jgi:hypothetical protein
MIVGQVAQTDFVRISLIASCGTLAAGIAAGVGGLIPPAAMWHSARAARQVSPSQAANAGDEPANNPATCLWPGSFDADGYMWWRIRDVALASPSGGALCLRGDEMKGGRETALGNCAVCWVCGETVFSGARIMRCGLCQGSIVSFNVLHDKLPRALLNRMLIEAKRQKVTM